MPNAAHATGARGSCTRRLPSRITTLFAWKLALMAGMAGDVRAETPTVERGMPLTEAISILIAGGLPVIYSSDVVRPDMRVAAEPESTASRALLDELLKPVGLIAREMPSGRIVIVRGSAKPAGRVESPARPDPAQVAAFAPAPLSEIVVTGSRYEFMRVAGEGQFALAAEDLERLPDLGDDPLRAVARLPGAATGGFTAKSNIRGGEADETLVRFDGFRLFNPFHLKDFQSLFSTIDPALVHSVEVYTGGFPVGLGDRMSGVIDVAPLGARTSPTGVVSVGLFSAGLLAADSFNQGRSEWLISGRRGNLDLLLDAVDANRGKPRYFDLHARLGHRFSDRLAVRASALRFADDLEISDGDQEEIAAATYDDAYYWITVDWSPRDDLTSRTYFGHASLDSSREGTADQPGIGTGALLDRRDSRMAMFESHWEWRWSTGLQFDFGAEFRRSEGSYDYADEAQFELLFDTPGAPTEAERSRSLSVRRDGDHHAAYVGARYEFAGGVTTNVGIRYDHDTLPLNDEDQWSPRAGIAWDATDNLSLRASWGRYAQSQGVQELQIADGVTDYLPAERADHLLVGFSYRPVPALELRFDAYEKRYRHLRPRFENLLNSFVLLPELKPDRIRIDADEATARGAELSLSRRDDSPFDWWLNYSWSSARDLESGRDVPRSWDQQHAFGGGLGWRNDRWDLSGALNWHSGWPTTSIELASEGPPVAIAAVGDRNARRLGSYFSLDLRVARRFVFDRSLLTTYLEVTNATNHRNDCCVGYEFNTEEDEPFLETDVEPYLTTLPNIGFTWEF